MLDEHVFLFVQLCFSIVVLVVTMIVVASAFRVITDLWTGQKKRSNAGLHFVNSNESLNETPEKFAKIIWRNQRSNPNQQKNGETMIK
ncbi:hypothetical protein BpHYR1_014453 [Brachionus plicatilis]|uniref:Uncharacterized protein n=1 Tax=Brachionus plicatilis TaxID=10195 RepID=A0A3M7RN81_BRAPC|nr:hypothetical protein BpHYR1_014453 [Brachionus plicatilis]